MRPVRPIFATLTATALILLGCESDGGAPAARRESVPVTFQPPPASPEVPAPEETPPAAVTTSTAPASPTTVVPERQWVTVTHIDEALGVRLVLMASPAEVGPGEDAAFVFRIENVSPDDFVYDSNTDFIVLLGNDQAWTPSCYARPAVVTYETLGPGEVIGGREIAYPGPPVTEECPVRLPPGAYRLTLGVFGCRQPRVDNEKATDANCGGNGSRASSTLEFTQR